MEKVDHIGIAVRNLDERITYYTETLGLKLLKVEEVRVTTSKSGVHRCR